MDGVLKQISQNVYTLKGKSLWVQLEDFSLWIINSDDFISVSVFGPSSDREGPIDTIYIKRNEETAK